MLSPYTPARLFLFIALLCCTAAFPAEVCDKLHKDAFAELDRTRTETRRQLTEYFERMRTLAQELRTDKAMLDFFRVKQRYYRIQKESAPPEKMRNAIEELKRSVYSRYLDRYMAFYDILCVDRDGDVFYTVRKQSDYHKNLKSEGVNQTAYARRLLKNPGRGFADFEYHSISGKPSAFFVEPVEENGKLEGWFVLQCAINKINGIFARSERLGGTGEVFLVNENCLMMTESRFRRESTILRQQLSRENIVSKFAEGSGHKIVTDYRGYRALTSFEVFPIFDSKWLLIAKIDEDELLTGYYRKHREKLRPAILKALNNPPECKPGRAGLPATKPVIVDMDDYRKVEPDGSIITFGVKTCTAVVISLPGRFAYLGHASAYDRMYGQGDMDLLGRMLERIINFEVYPYEQRDICFVIAAPHMESCAYVVDRLVDNGFFLGQIRILHQPSAADASVMHLTDKRQTVAEWNFAEGKKDIRRQYAEETPSLADLLKTILYCPAK